MVALVLGLLTACASTPSGNRNLQALADRTVDEVWASADFSATDSAAPGSSPDTVRLTAAMAARFPQLEPLYDARRIGLTRDGYLGIPSLENIPLEQRNPLRELVAEENADRSALYRAIAVAMGDRWQEPVVRGLFAERWLERARPAWTFQGADGAWINN